MSQTLQMFLIKIKVKIIVPSNEHLGFSKIEEVRKVYERSKGYIPWFGRVHRAPLPHQRHGDIQSFGISCLVLSLILHVFFHRSVRIYQIYAKNGSINVFVKSRIYSTLQVITLLKRLKFGIIR